MFGYHLDKAKNRQSAPLPLLPSLHMPYSRPQNPNWEPLKLAFLPSKLPQPLLLHLLVSIQFLLPILLPLKILFLNVTP